MDTADFLVDRGAAFLRVLVAAEEGTPANGHLGEKLALGCDVGPAAAL